MLVNFVRLPNLYGIVLILLFAINKWSLRPVPILVSTLPFFNVSELAKYAIQVPSTDSAVNVW